MAKTRGTERERHFARHRFLFGFLRFICSWFFRLRFRYTYEKVKLAESPAIILLNHNSDYDPIFAGIAIRGFMYFVASEHVYRWGFASKLLKFVFDPIIRIKGTTEAKAALEIMRTVRKGHSVCLFAEGNRSFNGETFSILPSTGKLVKRSGAALVTYVLRGNYLTTPRWGAGIRRGRITGELAGVYSKEQVAAMSDVEINELIVKDLYVNAFDDQKRLNVRYKGKKNNGAEWIEIALFICPDCGGIGTIKSEGDRFRCGCGLDMRYTEYGWLETASDKPASFDSVLEWDRWQTDRLYQILAEPAESGEAVFSDGGQTLYEIGADYTMTEVAAGRLSFYRDRLEFAGETGGMTFEFDRVGDIEITGKMTLTLSMDDGRLYEIRSAFPRSAAKYREGFRFLAALRQNSE